MFTIGYSFIIESIIISIIITIAARLHQIFLPRAYSSILDFRYSGDVVRTIRSSSIRLVYLAFISIGAYLLGFEDKAISFGAFMSAFLNVWPAIVQYNLLSVNQTIEKIRLLFGYTIFVVFSTVFSYISIHLIYKSIIGFPTFGPLDSKGMDLIFALVVSAGLCSIESILGSFAKTSKGIDVDSFRIDKDILINRVLIEEDNINVYSYEIRDAARNNNISENILRTLLILEYIHRAKWYIRALEGVICTTPLLYSFAINKDLSVGLAQIKISTAKRLLERSPKKFIHDMMDPTFSINLCAMYLREIVDTYSKQDCENNIYDHIASEYLSGSNDQDSEIIKLYSVVIEHFDDGEIYKYIDYGDKRHKITDIEEYKLKATKIENDGVIYYFYEPSCMTLHISENKKSLKMIHDMIACRNSFTIAFLEKEIMIGFTITGSTVKGMYESVNRMIKDRNVEGKISFPLCNTEEYINQMGEVGRFEGPVG